MLCSVVQAEFCVSMIIFWTHSVFAIMRSAHPKNEPQREIGPRLQILRQVARGSNVLTDVNRWHLPVIYIVHSTPTSWILWPVMPYRRRSSLQQCASGGKADGWTIAKVRKLPSDKHMAEVVVSPKVACKETCGWDKRTGCLHHSHVLLHALPVLKSF